MAAHPWGRSPQCHPLVRGPKGHSSTALPTRRQLRRRSDTTPADDSVARQKVRAATAEVRAAFEVGTGAVERELG